MQLYAEELCLLQSDVTKGTVPTPPSTSATCHPTCLARHITPPAAPTVSTSWAPSSPATHSGSPPNSSPTSAPEPQISQPARPSPARGLPEEQSSPCHAARAAVRNCANGQPIY
eukprot:139195-Prymnesium_polylepis.1